MIARRPASEAEKEEATRGLERTGEALKSGDYELVILDEVCVAQYFGLITIEQVIPLLQNRPETVELVLTGRYCPEEWIEYADLVTEMQEVKHYYTTGVVSRRGFDS